MFGSSSSVHSPRVLGGWGSRDRSACGLPTHRLPPRCQMEATVLALVWIRTVATIHLPRAHDESVPARFKRGSLLCKESTTPLGRWARLSPLLGIPVAVVANVVVGVIFSANFNAQFQYGRRRDNQCGRHWRELIFKPPNKFKFKKFSPKS